MNEQRVVNAKVVGNKGNIWNKILLAIVLVPYWGFPFPNQPRRVPEPGSSRTEHPVYYTNRLIWIGC